MAWSPAKSGEFADRATLGTSHVIYAKSPGGVALAAERTADWREEIERAANDHGVDPDVLEAMVFLESAGRPTVMADGTPRSATGLAQIIPSTATDLLGMQVDLERSLALTRKIAQAANRGRPELAEQLSRERAEVDQRFNPELALAGAARYLQIAEARFGSEELAVVSYHMGIGNLESVIAAYTGEDVPDGGAAELVDEEGLDYPRLFFDSSPGGALGELGPPRGVRRRFVSLLLARPGVAGRDEALARRSRRAGRARRPDHREGDPGGALPPGGRDRLVRDRGGRARRQGGGKPGGAAGRPVTRLPGHGAGGRACERAGLGPELYRALRPEALAALIYLSAKVKAISGENEPLKVTSATRDQEYQDLLVGVNPEATQEYSLHTTGWSFDIRRDYGSDAQAAAFQFALDRLRAHAILDYAYEPAAIHITVSEDARVLVD